MGSPLPEIIWQVTHCPLPKKNCSPAAELPRTLSSDSLTRLDVLRIPRSQVPLLDCRSMLFDVSADFANGSEPNPVGWIPGIVAQGLQRLGVRHLITPVTDLMTDKNDPTALFRCLLDRFHHLLKVHVIERRAQRLREVTECRVVCGFVEITAPNQKAFRDQGHIALCTPPSSDEFLPAGVGKGPWLCP